MNNSSDKNVKMFQELINTQGGKPGPINLSRNIAKPLSLPKMEWSDWSSKGLLTISNTGYTAVITGHWSKNRPSVLRGPFSTPFLLGQIHFHWGPDDKNGSEHTIEGKRFPLEMHVMVYKTIGEPMAALSERDGIAVIAYVFEIAENANAKLEPILEGLEKIRDANAKAFLCPEATNIVVPFHTDYFMYWGSINTTQCSHTMPWIVCSQAQKVSSDQLTKFRELRDNAREKITGNFCNIQPLMGRTIFVASTEEATN